MPVPAVLAALGRGAAQAAIAAARVAAAAARGAASVGGAVARGAGSAARTVGGGVKSLAQGGMSVGRAAINVARGAASGLINNASPQARNLVDSFKNIAGNIGNLVKGLVSRTMGGGGGGNNPPPAPPPSPPPNPPNPNPPNPNGGNNSRGSLKGDLQDMVNPLRPLTRELTQLPKKIKEFGSALVEGRREMLDYNGTISQAIAQLDAERIQRNIQIAGATSGSAKYQTEAHSRLEKALAPGQAAMMNVANRLTGFLENGLANILERFNMFIDAMKEMPYGIGEVITKALAKAPPQLEMPLNQFMKDMAAGKAFNRNSPPINPPGGKKP